MTEKDFWDEANRILNSYSRIDHPDGCDLFMDEMDVLFEDWQNAKEE